MLSCKKCVYNDCDCKADLIKALNLIYEYVPLTVIQAIEDIVEDCLPTCEDYEEKTI